MGPPSTLTHFDRRGDLHEHEAPLLIADSSQIQLYEPRITFRFTPSLAPKARRNISVSQPIFPTSHNTLNMVNPGVFVGSRKIFLESQKDIYAAAVAGNHVIDTVADIQRRYFKRYPIDLPHNEEPSDTWISQVDDDAPDPEIEAPNMDILGPAACNIAYLEYDAKIKNLKTRKEVSLILKKSDSFILNVLQTANQATTSIPIQQNTR